MDQTVRSRTRTRTLGIATIVAGVAITTLVPAAWSRGLRGDAPAAIRGGLAPAGPSSGWVALADGGVVANAPMILTNAVPAATDADAPRGDIKNVEKRPDNITRILGGEGQSTESTSESPSTPAPQAGSTPGDPGSTPPETPDDSSPTTESTSTTPTVETPANAGTESAPTPSTGANELPPGVVSDVDPTANESKGITDGIDDATIFETGADESTPPSPTSTEDSGAGSTNDTSESNGNEVSNNSDLTPSIAKPIPPAGTTTPVQKAIHDDGSTPGFTTAPPDSGAGQTRTVTNVELLPLLPLASSPAPVSAAQPAPAPTRPAAMPPAPMVPMAPIAPVVPAYAPAPPARSSAHDATHEPVSASNVETDGKFISSIKVNPLISNVITLTRSTSAVIDLHGKVDRVEVGNPSVATAYPAGPSRVVVIGRGMGSTELAMYMGDQERVLAVNVEMDMRPLRDMIASVAPGANVTPRNVNGTIVLTGTVPDSQTAEKLGELAALYETGKVQNQLRVAGVQQTQLRCLVAEVNKVALRQLGVNWALGGSDLSRDVFMANNLNQLNPTAIGSSGVANVLTDQQVYSIFPAANGGTTNFTLGFPRAELQFFINALRQNQLFRVLAEPNLTAISGQTAMFLAGGEVPIPVTQGGAVAGSITIEYKEFGVRLHFTPTVVGSQLVRLHVMSEFSDAIPGAAIAGGLPTFSFTTRRVESTVECGNGQTFAIAGLLSERVRAVSAKIPALGDIPILGALFSSVEYQKSNTELVILVTPELVQALDPQQVGPAPGSLMTDPDDYELFGLGKLEGPENERQDMDAVPRDEQEPRVFPPAGGPEAREWNRKCGKCRGRGCGDCGRRSCGDDDCDDDDCDDHNCDKTRCGRCGDDDCDGRDCGRKSYGRQSGKSCDRCGGECRGECRAKGKGCRGCGSSKCGGCDGKLIPMHGPTGTVDFDE